MQDHHGEPGKKVGIALEMEKERQREAQGGVEVSGALVNREEGAGEPESGASSSSDSEDEQSDGMDDFEALDDEQDDDDDDDDGDDFVALLSAQSTSAARAMAFAKNPTEKAVAARAIRE